MISKVEIINKYFDELSSEQRTQFEALGALYAEWNSKINVVSRKDIGELYTRHVLHSLAIAAIIEFKPGTKIIDVGCGGGFPGIPLAILFPEVEFTLVDSIGKKITVVNEISGALQLKNVKAMQQRAENIRQKYDFVVSRAVTAFPRFVAFSRHLVSKQQHNEWPNGILYLKGGDFDDELLPFANRIEIFDISELFEEAFFETKKIIYLPV
ncbi:16S rRNA (guanine(527)-N(7))-methyltransferase RsmG [Roseimarinus sediminis]|uniref:16S rRNA (guanine(527)-N(7))-methyltransferase RsmG n=1 Tax=Roseimarinus sediminis TaxID=1610899 RepID=UPI003D1F2FA8